MLLVSSLLKFSEAAPWKQRLAEQMKDTIAFCAYYLKVTPEALQARIESSDDASRMLFGVVFEDLLTIHYEQQTLVDA
jgi:hypothetical protein